MAVDPPTAPAATPSAEKRTDSGEHAAADKASVTIRGSTFTWRWSGVARAAVIAMAGLPALIMAIRAPSKGDVAAESKKQATEQATGVKKEVNKEVNKGIIEQADLQQQLARMAAAIQTLEQARQASAPAPAAPVAPGQPKPRRRRLDAETAKKVAAATADLTAIQAHAKAKPKPKLLPVEPPQPAKDQVQTPAPAPAQQAPNGAAGGANP